MWTSARYPNALRPWPVLRDSASSSPVAADPVWYRASLDAQGYPPDGYPPDSVGGIWDSIKSAYRTVSTPVTWVNKKIFTALKPLKPVISAAAGVVATAYGGPAAGALASKLAGPVIDSSAETGGDPTMLFEHAKKKTADPAAQKNLEHARRAIADTSVAYHLMSTQASCDQGDPAAQQHIAQLQRAASAGDPAAIQAMKVVRTVRALRARAGGDPRAQG